MRIAPTDVQLEQINAEINLTKNVTSGNCEGFKPWTKPMMVPSIAHRDRHVVSEGVTREEPIWFSVEYRTRPDNAKESLNTNR